MPPRQAGWIQMVAGPARDGRVLQLLSQNHAPGEKHPANPVRAEAFLRNIGCTSFQESMGGLADGGSVAYYAGTDRFRLLAPAAAANGAPSAAATADPERHRRGEVAPGDLVTCVACGEPVEDPDDGWIDVDHDGL